jgi:hypothetical protein
MSATRTDSESRLEENRRSRRSSRSVGTLASVLLLNLVLVSAASMADAQPSDAQIAEARQKFDQGKKAEDAGRWEEALHAFQDVGKVKMTPQVRFHIALADENLGHLAAALHGFEEAQDLAKKDPDNAKDVLENAPEHAKDLRARAPKLRVDVTGHGDYRVLLDGDALSPAQIGAELPVDPGSHTLVLEVTTSSGTVALPPQELTLRERATERIAIKVPEDHSADSAPVTPIDKPAPHASVYERKIPAIIAGSVGIASLVGAGVFLGLRQSAISQVRDSCTDKANDRGCDPRLAAVASNGKTDTYVSTTLAFVGVAGLATGAVLWFTIGNDKPSQSATRVTVSPSYLAVDGRF